MERRIPAGAWVVLGAGLPALLATALVVAATGMHEGWKNVAVAVLPLLTAAAWRGAASAESALPSRTGR